MSPFLLAGAAFGIILLAAFAFLLGRRGAQTNWRGYSNAAAAGIVFGAMVDLLPKALEFGGVFIATVLQAQVLTPMHAAPDSFWAIGAGILSEAVTPFGALLVLFLYLSGNSAPMPVAGRMVGAARPGWRTWFSIPATGEVDWKGVFIITFGLSAHNVWLGQARGQLLQPGGSTVSVFLLAFGLAAALRSFALSGSLVDVRARWPALLGCSAIIGGAGILGAAMPETGRTIWLGILPVVAAVLILPIGLGRLLRLLQYDVGLGWKTTLAVLAGLGVERSIAYLLLLLAQGQLGLPQ